MLVCIQEAGAILEVSQLTRLAVLRCGGAAWWRPVLTVRNSCGADSDKSCCAALLEAASVCGLPLCQLF